MPENAKRIILLEDDPLQAEWIAEKVIWESFPDAELRYIDSEYAFIQDAESGRLLEWYPQYALIDLMTRYFSPMDLENLTAKPDFSKLPEPKFAGIRCLAEVTRVCPNIKCAVVTTLDGTEIQKNHPKVHLIQKGNDALADQLVNFLKL